MRLHWTKEKVYEQIFKVRWRPGSTNLADFVTKLHEKKDFEDKRRETMVQCQKAHIKQRKYHIRIM